MSVIYCDRCDRYIDDLKDMRVERYRRPREGSVVVAFALIGLTVAGGVVTWAVLQLIASLG